VFQKYKRCKRNNAPGHAHYLTFSCYAGVPLLRSPSACSILADSVAKAREMHSFELWAWVFMPNHVHLLLFPTNPEYSISAILSSIKRPAAAEALRRLRGRNHSLLASLRVEGSGGRSLRFWQPGGGHDRNLTSIDAVWAAVDYIHNNPVRRGLVSQPQAWTWSSARDWVQGEAPLLQVDKTVPPKLG